jgi:hypothetical protein
MPLLYGIPAAIAMLCSLDSDCSEENGKDRRGTEEAEGEEHEGGVGR